jgi:hypothetical protein
VWTTVPASDSFTQAFPHDGAAPSDPTRVQVAYDDDNLYIAIDCVQHTPRLARLTRRDRNVDDDRISVDLDTAHDRRSAFQYAPGSAAFLVYSHAQIPSDDGTTFDLRSLPRGPSQNVVLLKLSWAWLR